MKISRVQSHQLKDMIIKTKMMYHVLSINHQGFQAVMKLKADGGEVRGVFS